MTRNSRSICAVLLLLLAPGGCQLTSDKPVLQPEDAVTLFGDGFVAAAEGPDGSLLDSGGKPSLLAAEAEGNVYVLAGGTADKRITLSFHPASDLPFDYIIQFHQPEATTYLAARRTSEGVAVANIELSAAVREALKARGVTGQSEKHAVTTAGSLQQILLAWSEDRGASAAFPLRYIVAAGEEAGLALMARTMTEFCLSRAGHPLDADVKRLPRKYAPGVTMERIDVAAAEEACDWALKPDAPFAAPASVRYALARAWFKAEKFEALRPILDELMAEDYPLAYVLRADQLARGLGMAKDSPGARSLLEAHAEDHPAVALTLGRMHAEGTFGEPDFDAARRYYERAAEAGVAPAETGLGVLYSDGLGVVKDEVRAYRLFAKAAEAGDIYGHHQMGRALYFGEGTGEDHAAAFGHLKTAAEAGWPEAQYFVGFMLARGQGVAKSEKDAVGWLTRASDAGNVSAKAELGLMTFHGLGITANEAKGRALLEEAVAAGDPAAREYLAGIERVALPPFASDVPDDIRKSVTKLGGDEDFVLDRTNLPFMAGMAQHFVEKCGLPDDLGDRAELTGLAVNGVSGLLGNDYSNPDILAGIGNMLGSNLLFVAGSKFAAQMSCDGKLAEHMAERLVAASRSNKGGDDAPFIPSCAHAFDERRCACLAQIGRGVIPDIYQRYYDREIIKEIISRNPLTALTIGLSCQIGDY